MAAFRIDPRIFEAFPEALVAVVGFEGVVNRGGSDAILEALARGEAEAARRFAESIVTEHPHIACWREAYRRFGAKPKDHPSSIENLVRRVLKGQRLRSVNRLVDIYNTVSLRHLVPAGGEDLDAVDGDIALTFAGEDEPAVRLLGEPEARPPKKGEVIYRDALGAICRRWNWKEADRTKLTEATTRGVLVLEALPPVDRTRLAAAAADLAALVETHCGGRTRTQILDRDNAGMELP